MYYFNIYFLFSIIGHLFESIVCYFSNGYSGILYGWWTPIYGIGSVLIIFFYSYILKFNLKKFYNYLIMFLFGFLFLSLIEYISGYLLEFLFDEVFWNYSSLPYNIGKYVALPVSLLWGVASIFLSLIKKYVDKFTKKIPNYITWIFIVLLIIDVLFTLVNKLAIF